MPTMLETVLDEATQDEHMEAMLITVRKLGELEWDEEKDWFANPQDEEVFKKELFSIVNRRLIDVALNKLTEDGLIRKCGNDEYEAVT